MKLRQLLDFICNDYTGGSCVYGQIMKHGFDLENHVAHALIDMLTKCDALAAAKSLFDKCGFEKSTVSWNIMMNGYLLHCQAEESYCCFSSYEGREIFSQILLFVTFVIILQAAAQLAAWRVGLSIQASLIWFGVCSHMPVGNRLVDMYAKCGMIESYKK